MPLSRLPALHCSAHRLTPAQGAVCFLCIVYTYFRVPEPSGRSFAELDVLFERGVSARKFATTDVDVFAEQVEKNLMNNYQKQLASASHVETAGRGV